MNIVSSSGSLRKRNTCSSLAVIFVLIFTYILKKGDKLLSFDMDLVKEKGYKTQTMFLVADAKGKEVEVVEAADADNNTKIMNLK